MDGRLLVVIAIGLSLAMAAAWYVQRVTRRSGWIDTAWSCAVGFGGAATAMYSAGPFQRRLCVLIIIVAWGARLASHIGLRTRVGMEDPRYASLMERWGDNAALRLFLFLQLQAAAAFVLVLSVHLAAANGAGYPRLLDIVAMLVAMAALVGEAVSDAQLARFRRSQQSATEVCETGLWRYSRHPNYFFEWLFWCCWPLFAVSASYWSWLSALAPIMMYWLLVHVSGIPPLEEHMLHSRGEKFCALQRRVNAFFPGPRKGGVRTSGDFP